MRTDRMDREQAALNNRLMLPTSGEGYELTGWTDFYGTPIKNGDIIQRECGRTTLILWEPYRAGFKDFRIQKYYNRKYVEAHPRTNKAGEVVDDPALWPQHYGEAMHPTAIYDNKIKVIDNIKNIMKYVEEKNGWTL